MILQPNLSEDQMYEALIHREKSFEGVFFVGVKTTGIFCRPTCRARKPKRENVEFFGSTKGALARGYRPCKVCFPMNPAGDIPPWIETLMRQIQADPTQRIGDFDLREKGLDPNRVRRWFKKNHDMTFQAYLRSLRLGHAFGILAEGESVTETALDSGYESLSGFSEAFKKTVGIQPSESRNKEVIQVSQILTPLGPMLAGAVKEGICLLEFTDRRMLETQLKILKKHFKASLVSSANSHFLELKKQLDQYFKGERKSFELSLVTPGTSFQNQVWRRLQQIPYGETCSYKDQAVAIKNPKAIRAVARANGENRIAIVIPCHRVIGSDGKLVGYGGGLWRKKFLLDLECKSDKN